MNLRLREHDCMYMVTVFLGQKTCLELRTHVNQIREMMIP